MEAALTSPVPYDALYLSPHLDDAAFSCGGQIYRFVESGQRVLVVTFMTGPAEGELSPAAEELHQLWGFEDAEASLKARREEDVKACAALGAEPLHVGLVDALYRRSAATGEPLYASVKAIFKKPHPDDEAQVERLAKSLGDLPEAKRICVPFGIGNHVDHVLVRRAAERVYGPTRLEYYEDCPYAHSRRAWWKAFGLRYPRGVDGTPLRWEPRVWPFGHDAMEAKCRASRCFASQIEALFGTTQAMEYKIRSYAQRVGGERLWWLAARH
jgi:LmbE family N-acetylglucosaminyl deacetylase